MAENELNEEIEEVEEEESLEDDSEPISAEEAAKIRAALKKANKEARDYRLEAKKLREQTESEHEKLLRQARDEAASETEAKYRGLLLNTAAKSALIEAGAHGNTDRLVRMFDFDALEISDDGKISGVDEQVKALKKDLPELFKKPGAPNIDSGNRKPTDSKLSTAEKLAAQLRGE